MTDFNGKVQGSFVDDDDIVRTGRAMIELDGYGFMQVPIPTGLKQAWDDLRGESSSSLQEIRSKAAQAAESSGAASKSATAAKTSASSAKQDADRAVKARTGIEEIAATTSWSGDKLTVNGKTSPSLRGPKGDKGETGSVENVSWDDITGKPDLASTWEQVKGKPATYPPAPHTHTTAQVEGLDAALSGKADKGHMHKVEDVGGLKERLDGYSLDIGSVTSSMGEIISKLDEKASISYLNSQIASTRSYVDRELANGSQIQVVSKLPSYPDSSTVYIVV
ncbi:hypothetical protein [Corynebacterium striatum]